MDRRRTESPVYTGQWSGGSSSTRSSSRGDVIAHPQSRLGPTSIGLSTVKLTQNVAAKAAAQRLARVTASQTITIDDGDEDGDDLDFRFSNPQPPPALSSFSNNNNNNNSNSLKSTDASSTIPPISLARPNRSPSPSVILVAIVPISAS
ncbi:hypothetical protein RIF29_31987 [Crotalaria pallida]|uniref:Uncharacterized protein n=1 Tax=Crotalaria pallida TaxID=3830 RepID=A0AAN9HXG5_CROPI